MKRKWYRIEDVEPQYGQEFHCWGEKIGMDTCEFNGKKFYNHGNPIDIRVTHVFPFPYEPRPGRR